MANNVIGVNIQANLRQTVSGADIPAKLDATATAAEKAAAKLAAQKRAAQTFVQEATRLITAQAGSLGNYSSVVTTSLNRAAESMTFAGKGAARLKENIRNLTAAYQSNLGVSIKDVNAKKSLSMTQEKMAGAVTRAISQYIEETAAINADTVATNKLDTATRKVADSSQKVTTAKKREASSLRDSLSAASSSTHVFRSLITSMTSLATLTNGLRASFNRFFGLLRTGVARFRRLVHVGKEWFDIATEFAEVNHLMYTSLVNLYTRFQGVSAAVKGSKEALESYTVELEDVLGNPLDKVITFKDASAAAAIRDATAALKDYSYWMMLDPTNVTKTYASFLEMADASKLAGDYAVALAYDMTQLTYDMASLWDIPFEESATKLRSALSGITRAIRSQGVDVGRAAADAWLAKKGIDAVYNSLSLGDKILVQFNLAVEGAVAAQGDLAASVLQPANLFRILKEQVTQTARAFGAALFPVLTAIIPLLIVAAEAARKLANTLAAFLGRKLGKTYTDAADAWSAYADNFKDRSGVKTLEEYAEGAEGVADGLGSAGKAAKDFKKQLLGFDEINNLTETADTSGGSGGGALDDLNFSGLIGLPNYSDIMGDVRTQIYAKAAQIRDDLIQLFDVKFGAGSFDAITKSLKNFKEALFGVKREESTWDSQRKKVAAIRGEFDELPTVVDRTGTVVERLQGQWKRFLQLIGANDVPTFFDNFLKGVLEGINAIQDLIDKMLDFGERLKETFGNKEGAAPFAETLGKIVTYITALTLLSPMLAPLTQALSTTALAVSQIGIAGAAVSLPSRAKATTEAAEAVTKTPKSSIFTRIGEKLDPVGSALKGGKAAPGLSSAELAGKSAQETLEAIGKTASRAESPLTKIGNIFTKIGETTEGLKGKIGGLGKAFGELSALGKFNVILTIVTVFIEMYRNSENLRNSLRDLFQTLGPVFESIIAVINALTEALAPIFGSLGNILAVIINIVVNILQNIVVPFLNDVLVPVIEWIGDKISKLWNWLSGGSSDAAEDIDISMTSMKTSMKDAFKDIDWESLLGPIWESISSWFIGLWHDVVNWLAGIWKSISDWFVGIWNSITTWFNDLITGVGTWLSDTWTSIKTWFLDLPNKIKERLQSIYDTITSNVKAFLQNPLQWGIDFILGFWNGINQKVQWVKDRVSSAFTSIGNKVKQIFGIASPSKLMAEYGGYVAEGFEIGVENGIPAVLETVNALATGVNGIMAAGVLDVGSLASTEMEQLNDTLSTGVKSTSTAIINAQNNDLLTASQTEIGLLREQNGLLAQLLEKEFGVSLDGNMLAASINKASRVQGRPLVWA